MKLIDSVLSVFVVFFPSLPFTLGQNNRANLSVSLRRQSSLCSSESCPSCWRMDLEIAAKVVQSRLVVLHADERRHHRRSYAKIPTMHNFRSRLLWVCLSLPPLVPPPPPPPPPTLLFFHPICVSPPSPRSHPHSLFPPCAAISFDRTLFVPTPSHTAHRHRWRDLSRSGFSSLSLSLPSLCFSWFPLPRSLSLPPSFIIISSHFHITEASIIFAVGRRIFSPFFFFVKFYIFHSFLSNSFTPSGCSSKTGTNMFYFQLVIMAGTILLAYYFEYTDTFPVHIQGFFCFDKSYSKPYPGPEDNSKAPPVLVYSLVTAIPTVTVSLRSTSWKKGGGGKQTNPKHAY